MKEFILKPGVHDVRLFFFKYWHVVLKVVFLVHLWHLHITLIRIRSFFVLPSITKLHVFLTLKYSCTSNGIKVLCLQIWNWYNGTICLVISENNWHIEHILEYADIVWNNCTLQEANLLMNVHEKADWIITGLRNHSSKSN